MKHVDKILIVDDDQTSTFLVKTMLEDMQIASAIATATNGREALDYINAQCLATEKEANLIAATFCPELILLDINMPVMNGFEFLEECRQKQCFRGNQVKVVMLSSSSSAKDIQQAKAFHVTAYLVKPITEEKLTQLLSY